MENPMIFCENGWFWGHTFQEPPLKFRCLAKPEKLKTCSCRVDHFEPQGFIFLFNLCQWWWLCMLLPKTQATRKINYLLLLIQKMRCCISLSCGKKWFYKNQRTIRALLVDRVRPKPGFSGCTLLDSIATCPNISQCKSMIPYNII